MAHAGGGGRLAAAPGCPRRGLPLLGGGGGEQPPARPPGLSGGLETTDRAQPGAGREVGGWTKGTCGGEGAAGGKEGSPGRKHWLETRGAALFPTWGTAEGPEGRGRGNRMGGGAGDSLSRGLGVLETCAKCFDHGPQRRRRARSHPNAHPPFQDLAAFSQLTGSQSAKGAPPRPCLTRPAFWAACFIF